MKFTTDDFKHLYAEMPDEELRSLVRAELSDVARPCYDAELARRGFSAAAPARRPAPPVVTREPERPERFAPLEEVAEEETEREAEEDLAPAAIFASRDEAKAAKALLQSAAIPAFLEDDTSAGGGFRLLVAASYVDQARETLAEAPTGDAA